MTGISRVRAYGRRRFAGTMASCGSASARQMKVFLSAIPRIRGGMERSALPARGQRLDRSLPVLGRQWSGLGWYMPSPIAAAASSINCSCLRWRRTPANCWAKGRLSMTAAAIYLPLRGQRFINAPVGTTSLLLRAGLKMAGRRYCARAR